ncbi:MAG: hypothetical protein [Caudoviricetes sp.]|nr:MAG: hypothetical protein [Caudoviricetes sp.]
MLILTKRNNQKELFNMNKYDIELTDTFAGEANYSWVKRDTITMPELTHYGYDGSTNYTKCNKVYRRELMKKAKAALGLTGLRGTVDDYGDSITFRPYRTCQIMFITFKE